MTNDELERLDDRGTGAWNDHDPDTFADLFADEFVLHDWTLPGPIRNDRDAVKRYMGAWIQAFPDMKLSVIDRVVGDDKVAGELEFSGTNSGPMVMGGMEMPPTNRSVTGRGTYFVHVRNGKIVEFRANPDAAGIMMQLGLMPNM
jgi:predicted ester cyclase